MAWYRCGGGGIPSSLKNGMNSVLNKKFGTSTTYAPATWPDNVNLLGPLPEKTVSGAIASFSDGADDVPLKNCVCDFVSLQGVSSVGVVHCGKNVWNEQWEVGSIDGEGQDVPISTRFRTVGYIRVFEGLRYFLVTTQTIGFRWYKADKSFLSSTTPSKNAVFTVPSNACYLRFVCTTSNTYNNDISINYPSTETEYNAYTGETHTASLGRTIYGGSVDVVQGTGTDGYNKVAISDLDWTYDSTYHRFISSNITGMKSAAVRTLVVMAQGYETIADGRAIGNVPDLAIYNNNLERKVSIHDSRYTTKEAFLQAQGNIEIKFPLATPETFTFDAVPISSYYGNNNIWADAGDVSCTYRADIDLAINGGA